MAAAVLTAVLGFAWAVNGEGMTVILQKARSEKHHRSHEGYYYDNVASSMQSYPVPGYARMERVVLSRDNSRSFEVTVDTEATIPQKTKARLTIEAYFDSLGVPDTLTDFAVVYCHGSSLYRSKPILKDGDAGVVDLAGHALLGKGRVVVKDKTIAIKFERRLVGHSTNLRFVILRYLPEHVDLARVSGGGYRDTIILDPSLENVMIALPSPPG